MYSDYKKILTNMYEDCARNNEEGFGDFNSPFFQDCHVANSNNGSRTRREIEEIANTMKNLSLNDELLPFRRS